MASGTVLNSAATTTSSSPSTLPPIERVKRDLVVCIIGAGDTGQGGIGTVIAEHFARAGASGIILTAHDADSLAASAMHVFRCNPRVRLMTDECDMNREESINELDRSILKVFGRLDVVVLAESALTAAGLGEQSGRAEYAVADGRIVDLADAELFHAADLIAQMLARTEDGARQFIAIDYATSVPGTDQASATRFNCAKLVEYLAMKYSKQGLSAFNLLAQASPAADENLLRNRCGAVAVQLSSKAGEDPWLNAKSISATWSWNDIVDKLGQPPEDVSRIEQPNVPP